MRIIKKLVSVIVAIIIFIVGTCILLYSSYIRPYDSKGVEKVITFKEATGKQIGKILYENKLIKSDKVFYVYLRLNNINHLKGGTYKLSQKMSLKEIVDIIQKGNNYTDETIKITFKEGINFRDIAKVIENNTNNSYEDVLSVLNDKEYLNSLIEDYWFITDDILNEKIYYPLEGYLFPDTYEFRNKDVTISEIFKKLLDQMEIVLNPYREKIENDKYSIHEILTLSSLAEKEVTNKSSADNRKKVVSVFVNRLDKRMSLGSDVTTRYGLKIDDQRPLTKSEYASSNAYNTRNVNMTGLPVGPISTVSKDSIEASVNRISTNYLYFIANINTSETFFFETISEFEKKKSELSKVNGGY